MAKTTKTKLLTTCKATSSVRLSIGDEQSDMAEISLRFELGSTLDEARRYSSSVQLSIVLPDGAVVADPVAANQVARQEAAAILRKMASQLAKG